MNLAGILAYVLAQLLIGAWVSRRIRTESDYLLAGRSLGYGLGIFTIFATWFGAETCIGAAGAVYEGGLSGASSDPFGYALCLLFMGLFFVVPLWRRRLTTLADLFRQRFSPGVERLAVLLLVPTSLLWAAAQIRAFGQVLAASSGLSVDATIALAAGVAVLYTAGGGLLADAMTDLVQGILVIAGLLLLLFASLSAGSGGAGLAANLRAAAATPGALTLASPGMTPLALVESWAIPVVGSVVAAELVARVIAMRTATVARRSCLIASGAYLLVGLVPVTLGLAGRAALPGLEQPEQVLPLLAQIHLPGVLYVLFAGALVSAILSTVDSALLVASSLVSHNLVVPLRPGMSERAKVRLARAGVAVFGAAAWLIALRAEGVYHLVEEASAFGSAGIFVVVLFALCGRQGGSAGAYAALVSGAGVWVLGSHLLELPYPYLTSLAASLAAYATAAAVRPLLDRTARASRTA